MANGSPQLQGAAQECFVQKALSWAPLVHGLLLHRVPGSVLHQPAGLELVDGNVKAYVTDGGGVHASE